MIKIIKYIKLNYSIFKNILGLTEKKIKIVFYSENKSYQMYNVSLIKFFANKYPDQVYYVSSDINDKYEDLNIKNLYIGKGLLMNFFFSILRAEYLFLTLTDLGNHSLRKSKKIEKYIYYFHSGGSTFQQYTEGSFDNYDIIFCNGKFHIDEIRFRENKKNLPNKKLILTGFFYFDDLSKKINLNNNPDEILIAPSWNYGYTNYINENFIKVIDVLLRNNYKVAFRPHPEHYKRSKTILKTIIEKFDSNKYFRFDFDSENVKSMEKAKCIITDISNISFEYTLLLNRPVIYLEGIEKIHNKNYSEYNNFESIENKLKKKFGFSFFEKDINKIGTIVGDVIINFKLKIPQLENFKKEYFFNFAKSIDKFEKIWEDQINND
jgi:hypothetical protein